MDIHEIMIIVNWNVSLHLLAIKSQPFTCYFDILKWILILVYVIRSNTICFNSPSFFIVFQRALVLYSLVRFFLFPFLSSPSFSYRKWMHKNPLYLAIKLKCKRAHRKSFSKPHFFSFLLSFINFIEYDIFNCNHKTM